MRAAAVYFALFWVAAAVALVLFIAGKEDLAGIAGGAAVVALVGALLTDWRRRHPR